MQNLSISNRFSTRLPSLEEIRRERLRRSTSVALAQDADSVRERCKTLAGFIRESWHVLRSDIPYVHNWHIDFLCQHLEAITTGRFLAMGLENRLLANVPPGTLKSWIVSVFFPAHEWGPAGMDNLQYIATSFREDLCKQHAATFRKLVESEWYQRHWAVKITKANDTRIENERGGFRQTVPFGSLTGGRADRLIIDDPHSVDTAESDAERAKAEMRFRESGSLRLNIPTSSAIIVIMQRLHEKDISGVILANKMPYVHIRLPMRFEPESRCVTPLGEDPRTYDGELLFPERSPEDVVARDEATIGPYAVAGQYQQRPSPRGGLLFKRAWFKIVKVAPGDVRRVRAWDLAASEEKHSAYTCGVRVSYDAKARHFYIEHVTRARVANPEQMILNTANQDGRNVEIDLPQDPGSAGKIQARSIIAALNGFRAYATPESGDKITRADPIAAQAMAGNVSLVEAPWNEEYLSELEKFPTGQFKDQVDATSRAFGRFILIPASAIVAPFIMRTPARHFGDHPGMG